MGGIGIVMNPRSLRNRRAPETGRRLRAVLGDAGELREAGTPDELADAVERFRAAGIDVLGVAGGDGTTHVVLTAFTRAYGAAPLPALLPLRCGAMNTVARGHRVTGTPERLLERVLARRAAGLPLRTVDRDLLEIAPDGDAPTYGFIFGTGGVVTFLEAYEASGHPSPSRGAWLVARAVGSAFTGGRFARALGAKQQLVVTSDGEVWPDESYFTFLCGSTPEIGFGVRAFARCDEQPGFFHAVGIFGGLRRLTLALPGLRRGRPWRRRLAVDEVARDVLIEGEPIRFTVDGDLYAARRSVRVRTGPAVRIVLP
ncbi:MAG: diacylglycerol kinase family protein [Anaeromyxobacteraceae bacterium]